MGGAGMAAVCTGILAPSGERGLKRGGGSPFSRRRAASGREKDIRAADTPDKTRLAANLLRLAANLGHSIAVNVGLRKLSANLQTPLTVYYFMQPNQASISPMCYDLDSF